MTTNVEKEMVSIIKTDVSGCDEEEMTSETNFF
jgi:hypothetical protein